MQTIYILFTILLLSVIISPTMARGAAQRRRRMLARKAAAEKREKERIEDVTCNHRNKEHSDMCNIPLSYSNTYYMKECRVCVPGDGPRPYVPPPLNPFALFVIIIGLYIYIWVL
jgi:hypothetical protein